MGVTIRTREEIGALAIRALHLDENLFVLEYPESICASLRRAASFLCPTTPRALVDAVIEILTPLVPEAPTRNDLMSLMDQLVSTGDLVELSQTTPERSTRLLFLGPPSFVEKSAGHYLVTGIRPLGAVLLPSDIPVQYEAHTRTVLLEGEGADARLREAGMHKISVQQWIGQPATTSAGDFIDQFSRRLDVARSAGFVDGLSIIDPSTRPNYYRGRWRPPAQGDSGDFAGRRPQAYGTDRWCVVRLEDGSPKRLLDLPLDNAVSPARDDAWRLQSAIDAERGANQSYRMLAIPSAAPASDYIVDFFSPLPSWVERYLELTGKPVDKSRGALFSYRFPASTLPGLQSVLTEALWMTMTEGESQ